MTTKKQTYQSPIIHSWVAKGARIERDAFRKAARREIKDITGAMKTPASLAYLAALDWALAWCSLRAKRTRKPGGVGRLVLVLTCLLLAPSIHAAPLDWTQGFSTDYASRVAGTNDMWNPGTYTFDSSALNNHALWETGGDATGDGLFMLVNGRDDMADSLVWGKVLDLGSPFQFAAKNLCCTGISTRLGPLLEFWLDGSKFGDIMTDGPGVWEWFSFITPAGSHLYEIRDGSTVYDGNDSGLDAVGTVPTPEPFTIITMGSGLLMIAKGLRRKRVAARAV